jgi:hypothetical protein
MSSQRRIDSSRANGARSRGPKTAKGLARSQSATLTHGLTARQIVLPGESEDEFRALRDAYLVGFRPRSPHEVDLVTVLAATRWRLNRLACFEVDLYNAEMARQEPGIPKEFKLAAAYCTLCDESNAIANLYRYTARLNRLYWAALEKLTKTEKCNTVPVPQTDTAPHVFSTDSALRTPLRTKTATPSQSHE